MTPFAPRKSSRHGLLGAVGAIVCLAVLVLLQALGAFRTADMKVRDARYLLRGPRPAADAIALVTIDDATIEAYGRWPLPRSQYAVLIGALEEAGARVIGFDLLLFDPLDPADDSTLVILTGEFDNVVHAYVFPPRNSDLEAQRFLPEARASRFVREGIAAEPLPVWQASEIALPFDDLLFTSPALGHVAVLLDRDGPVRRVPFLVGFRDRVYPALALRMVGLARGDSSLPVAARTRHGVSITWQDGTRLDVPVDGEGGTTLDYAGDIEAFPHRVSMLDVVQWYQAADTTRLAAAFANRIVLVGNTAVGEAAADIGTTPFSNKTPLVYVHANALDALLGGRFVHHAPPLLFYGFWALAAALLGWLVMTRPLLHAAVGVVAVTLAWQAAAYALLVFRRIDMPSLLPALLPFTIYATLGTFRLFFVERHARETDRELKVARDIQQKLLPQEPPAAPEFDVFGTNLPAQEVGGDYFDWLSGNGKGLLVALGDVSGKGVSASLLMSHLRASLHVEARNNASPADIAREMHRSMYTAVERGRFATFFLARLARPTGELVFCNAGHNPPILVSARGVELLEATGLPLGLMDIDDYEEGSRPFDPGDVLVVFSDGVTEAPSGSELYGDDRLLDLVTRLADGRRTSSEIGQAILEDVAAFTRRGNDWDDVTVLVVRRKSDADPTSSA
ncbi:MAG TPA: CHASE2 domain-containing protein [Candidatus Eisenbacteria bacterium]